MLSPLLQAKAIKTAAPAITSLLPVDYRLYLESMMPWMNEVPIGVDHFNKNLQNQLVDESLTDHFWDSYDADQQDLKTYHPNQTGEETLTGWDTLFNTLGSYQSKVNPPAAGADPSVTITDRYDWNPDYDEEGYGGEKDVTVPMFGKFLWNTRPKNLGGTGFSFSDTAEMAGNLFGHRQTEGKGRDVNMTIPVSNEKWRSYQPNVVSGNTTRGKYTNMFGSGSNMFGSGSKRPNEGPNRYFTQTKYGKAYNTGGIVSLML